MNWPFEEDQKKASQIIFCGDIKDVMWHYLVDSVRVEV